MNEGVYRVLLALGDGAMARSAVIRACGESHSVIAEIERDKPKWLSSGGKQLKLSDKGKHALDMERRARTPALDSAQLVAKLEPIARARPSVKRELDQVFATLPTVAKRALHLVAAGEAQRGVLMLGDDDLTSIAIRLLLDAARIERPVHALDVDEELVSFLRANNVEAIAHDIRTPLPSKWQGRFGAVFTDPPYAPAGFTLFTSRAVSALKNDGRLYVCFGWSRRARERGLAKQRVLAATGLLVEDVTPGFNNYDGAESIGARSDLWVCAKTPQSKPIEVDEDAELYTRTND